MDDDGDAMWMVGLETLSLQYTFCVEGKCSIHPLLTALLFRTIYTHNAD